MGASLDKVIFRVECYGQGKIHEDILKELNISKCEGPEIPCILFVYKTSRDNEDLRNALQWVTDKRAIRKEDICAVLLLEKIPGNSKDGIEEMETKREIFNKETKVYRVSWKEISLSKETMDSIKELMNLPIVKSSQGEQNKTEESKNEMESQCTGEQNKIEESKNEMESQCTGDSQGDSCKEKI